MLKVNIKSFAYAEKEILKYVSFQLDRGEHLAVLGESGCGKSTLLHIVYGLLHLEKGQLSWNGKPLLGPKHHLIPGEDNMKLVAQEYNVMPFTSVTENIATHLSRNEPEKEQQRIQELLEVVDLVPFAETKVKHLSGGQKQRVALATALAQKPEVLLLDEPFSSIDTFRKNKLRRLLFNYLKQEEITCITATHDAEEALAYTDNILLLKDGKMERYDAPEEVYSSLATIYQVGFFGDVTILPPSIFNSEKELYLLPHQLEISKDRTPLSVTIKANYFKGNYYLVEAFVDGTVVFFNHSEKVTVKKVCLKLKE